jgi:hypothetical protein
MATNTDELETAIQSGYVDNIQKSEAERILREHEKEPYKKLARRTYNAAAWARAYSVIVALNCCIIALIILWLGETSGRSKLPSLRLHHWPLRRSPRRKSLQRHLLKPPSLRLHRLPLRRSKRPSRRTYHLLPRQSPSLKSLQRHLLKPPSPRRHRPLPHRKKLRCLQRRLTLLGLPRRSLLPKSPWLRRRRPTR